MTVTTLSLLNIREQQQQQQEQPSNTQASGPTANDCSNNYHRCDDGDEENRCANVNTNNNDNTISPPVPLNATSAERLHNASPWYNQKLIITIPIGQVSIPHRPKELLVIPEDLWVEFYVKVQEVAAAASSTTQTSSATVAEANIICSSCCSSSLVHSLAISLSCIGVTVICFLMGMGIIDFDSSFTLPLVYLYLLWMCLKARKSRIDLLDFDKHQCPKIQAVCSLYSPVFEEQSNYFVEYKNYKTGLQFRHKIIRQFAQEQQSDRRFVGFFSEPETRL